MNCNKEKNIKKCTCTYEPCSRKGICCECILYHRKYNEAPACLFPSEVESTYDRSLERLARCYNK
ncbi:DUF6485 family protein [Pelotomaculum schinkii]|uniref:DUF6485 family protein n=1 Tax=Pelotomaculum schinkii TaxID=78350 RepID=UPI001FA99296|nr:DUF6485 family protein [Pelotomaculum schinkii]